MIVDNIELKVNDVGAFKLMSGEEIVSKILDITDEAYIISKPMAMTLMPSGNQAQVAFVPWSLGMPEDAKIKLNKAQIVASAKARTEAAAGYLKQTSGLEVPENPGLIL